MSQSSKRAAAFGAVVTAVGFAGCGDDLPGVARPIAQADTLIITAHFDDDMIFMQPELHRAITTGSLTTVYVSSGDPVHGDDRAEHYFEAAMIAYSSVAGSSDWDCGYLLVDGSPVHHCRLSDRPISIMGLDTADGGLPGDFLESPLHLVENRVTSIPILGPIGGRATVDSIVGSLREIITATQPTQIHALDLASTHGRDHSGHLFSAAFAFWAAARAGYEGPIRWHRGYNVESELPTLSDTDYETVKPMIGYYDACYFGCGACGTSCPTLNADHDGWMRRQYSSIRSPLEALGALALDGTGFCVAATVDGAATLGDCAAAAPVELAAGGHLRVGDACLASPLDNDGPVTLAPCQATPSQYWLIDGDGMLWNGRPPVGTGDGMDHDHVRCLHAEAAPGATLRAPLCGEHRQTRWRF